MTIDDIALTLQPGLGTKGIARLLSVMGDATTIYSSTAEELQRESGLRIDIAREIVRRNHHRDAAKELNYLSRNNLKGIASTDPEYPAMLLECPDYPHVLYVRGDTAALGGLMLSMVATRVITPYGQRMCDVLVGRMAELQPVAAIVSGLAFGVDANCHRAALRHGLKTVAVMPNPLPGVVPAQHRNLADEIVKAGGALVSELNSSTKQNGAYYIPRNRIIAGMSGGTVVVESPYGGGSLTTAELAFGYDRIVMAVPGRAGDRSSEGANALIRMRKASMICSADDICREMGWDMDDKRRIHATPGENHLITSDEQKLLSCFAVGETVGLDALSARSGITVGELAALTLSLELAGLIRSLPGKTYERI